MMIRTLRAPEEVRRETAYFEDIEEGKLDESAIKLAQQIGLAEHRRVRSAAVRRSLPRGAAELIKANQGEKIVTAEVAEPPLWSI